MGVFRYHKGKKKRMKRKPATEGVGLARESSRKLPTTDGEIGDAYGHSGMKGGKHEGTPEQKRRLARDNAERERRADRKRRGAPSEGVELARERKRKLPTTDGEIGDAYGYSGMMGGKHEGSPEQKRRLARDNAERERRSRERKKRRLLKRTKKK